jgi:hypothetical protein
MATDPKIRTDHLRRQAGSSHYDGQSGLAG